MKVVEHVDDGNFVINMHAIHNAALIRKALPRHLTKPKPYLQDKDKTLSEIALKLNTAITTRRAETNAKNAAARAKRKAAASELEAVGHRHGQASDTRTPEQASGHQDSEDSKGNYRIYYNPKLTYTADPRALGTHEDI